MHLIKLHMMSIFSYGWGRFDDVCWYFSIVDISMCSCDSWCTTTSNHNIPHTKTTMLTHYSVLNSKLFNQLKKWVASKGIIIIQNNVFNACDSNKLSTKLALGMKKLVKQCENLIKLVVSPHSLTEVANSNEVCMFSPGPYRKAEQPELIPWLITTKENWWRFWIFTTYYSDI